MLDFATWLNTRMQFMGISDWKALQSLLAARGFEYSESAIRSWMAKGKDRRTPRLPALRALLDILGVTDREERGRVYDLAAKSPAVDAA